MEAGKGKTQRFQVSKPSPIRWSERVSAATSFYAAFRPLFRQVGRWCTGIPFEHASLYQNPQAPSETTVPHAAQKSL